VFYFTVKLLSLGLNYLKMLFKKSLYIFVLLISFAAKANFILLPMDETTQKNHLKKDFKRLKI
jgi:hypothetical protein